jgi:hypothetical protein
MPQKLKYKRPYESGSTRAPACSERRLAARNIAEAKSPNDPLRHSNKSASLLRYMSSVSNPREACQDFPLNPESSPKDLK